MLLLQFLKPCEFYEMRLVYIEKKRKDYAFWHQIIKKPSTILACPGLVYIVDMANQYMVDRAT